MRLLDYTLPRDNGKPWERQYGTWKPLQTKRGQSATVTCPDCGCYGSLEDHRISQDGNVTPSVVCPVGCGFEANVILTGWAECLSSE